MQEAGRRDTSFRDSQVPFGLPKPYRLCTCSAASPALYKGEAVLQPDQQQEELRQAGTTKRRNVCRSWLSWVPRSCQNWQMQSLRWLSF